MQYPNGIEQVYQTLGNVLVDGRNGISWARLVRDDRRFIIIVFFT